jgi:hypothetical protein
MHGLGVYATRRLVLGDVIMVEDPVLEGLMGDFTPRALAALDAKLTSDFEKLDPNTQVGIWRLGTGFQNGSGSNRIQGFDDQKLKKKIQQTFFISFFDQKLQFTYVQAI